MISAVLLRFTFSRIRERYVNQRAVLEHRAALVERLFAEPPGPDVIVCD